VGGAEPRHMGSESDRAGWYGPVQDFQAPCRDKPMDLPRAQPPSPSSSPSPIPREHQDLTLSRDAHRSKWDYERDTLREVHGIENPTDDMVRMFANRGISAELKQAYVDKAKQGLGKRGAEQSA
jgi:hypothetical protein